MLPQRRSSMGDTPRRARQLWHYTRLGDAPEGRLRYVDNHLPLPVVRLCKDIGHAHEGCVGHLMQLELARHILEGMRGEPGFNHLRHLGHVRGALRGGGKTRRTGEFWLLNHGAQSLEQVLGWRCEYDPTTVLGLACPTRPGHVLQPTTLADYPLPAIQGDSVFQNAEGRLIQRRINPLPFARGVTASQRGQHTKSREQASEIIRTQGWRPAGRPIRRAVEVPRPTKRRANGSEARTMAPRSSLSESRHPRHHQAWVKAAQVIPTEMPALQHTRAEI